jgi:glycosyltransferase involved in cell wall biosynthesis
VKYLFIHQNFPGQYLHFVRHLLKDQKNEVVFISEPNANHIVGVRRIAYQMPKSAQDGVHGNARDYEQAARRAELVAGMAANVKRLGFTPDIIIGHHGWGELLNLVDVFPGVPILGYFEFYYRTEGQDVGFDAEFPVTPDRFPRIRAMNATNLLALALEQHGQTPTQWQRQRYPQWAHRQIQILPEGAMLDLCKPDPAARKQTLRINDFVIEPHHKLVTYVTRNLEPYRGFHIMMRSLPPMLSARSDVRVVLVGGDDVSYGARLINTTWREHFQRELAGTYDTSRVLLPGQVKYDVFLSLLRRTDAHVYLTYPFVASWSLREALACGCPIVAADVDPVREFISDGRTGLLTPALDPRALADRVLHVLEDKALIRRLRTGARKHAETHLRMEHHIAAFEARVAELVPS